MPPSGKEFFILCNQCTLPIPVPVPQLQARVVCGRCGHHINKFKPKSLNLTLAFSLTALILYIPANTLPFMTMELYGIRNTATIWTGILQLAEAGSLFIALIVFLASLFIPLIKLLVLFYVSLTAMNNKHRRLKTHLFRFVELIGRWSMLDIFLLAVLIAIMKLGPWSTVEPEPGAVMFALVVIFTMLATESFDARLLWGEHDENSSS